MSTDQIATPKLHLLLHITAMVSRRGNPRTYATWGNEADNKVMRQVLRNVHQRSFEGVGLGKLRALIRHKRSAVKRARR